MIEVLEDMPPSVPSRGVPLAPVLKTKPRGLKEEYIRYVNWRLNRGIHVWNYTYSGLRNGDSEDTSGSAPSNTYEESSEEERVAGHLSYGCMHSKEEEFGPCVTFSMSCWCCFFPKC